MTNLFVAELRRALARRLVRLFAALALLGIVIAGLTVLARSQPGGEALDRRIAEYERRVRQCVDGELQIPIEPGEGGGFVIPQQEREDFCRFSGFLGPQPGDETFRLTKMRDVLRGTTVPLVIASFLLGASLIGAEWRAGTVTTALTWEPHRLRLFLTKLAVAIVVCVGLLLAVQVFLTLALVPAAMLRGTTAGADGAFFGSLLGILGRGALVTAVAAAIGFGIGATGRNTAAALGIAFGYVVLLEGFLAGNLEWFRGWSFIGNSIVWVSGSQTFDILGRSVAEAGVILSLYGTGVAAAAAGVFRARDVT